MSSEVLKRTALFEAYGNIEGVRLTDFGGWELPLDFGPGIVAEHKTVRTSAGIFDVSHMGELLVEGPDCQAFLNWVLTNEIADYRAGKAVYSPMCFPSGGTVDDLLVYQLSEERALLVVNAANTEKDLIWMRDECPWPGDRTRVSISDVSEAYAQIALQGPRSETIVAEITSFPVSSLSYYHFSQDVLILDQRALISRTGYTGEDGFEIYLPPQNAADVWSALMEKGAVPVGLGARDTLRMEARLPLYGHELTEQIMPTEAGLKSFVKSSKGQFCGREALEQPKSIVRSLRGFEMIDPAVPRQGYAISMAGEEVGFITSGGKSPTLDSFIALAMVKRGKVRAGDIVGVSVRNKEKRAKAVKTPFYRNVKSG